jgi:PAS domain S-box-containing protein
MHESQEAPDPNATGAATGLPGDQPGLPGRERTEREAAWRRAERRAQEAADGQPEPRDPYMALAREGVAHRAFAALAENVRDYAIFLMDPDGIITFWGEGARLIKWWTKAHAEGSHLRLLYLDGGSEDGTAEAHLEQAADRGEYVGEGQRVRSDGSTFWGGITLTALRDADGTLLGFAKVARDLTAAHAADAALRAATEAVEARRRAEEADRAKGEFLATMTHELRTPLQAILAYTDLLAMQLSETLTDAQRAQLGRIRASSMHLAGLTDEILDFSRLEAGHLSLRAAAAHRVGTAIEQALMMVHPQAQARGLEVSDAVATSAADQCYWGDEERVRQILLNLLGNAVKFTPSGGRIVVSAGTTQRASPEARLGGAGPWAYVRVEDTGEGIPADRLEAIFEPYERAGTSHTRQHGGAGLGLAISQRLARLMGGDLTVKSELGIGSSFFLWLPTAPSMTAETEATGP